MAVLIPNDAIAARWRGAREARLREAPLEYFLRSRGEAYLSGTATELSKNIATGVVVFAAAGLASYRKHHARALGEAQIKLLTRATCAMSYSLANSVRRPGSWRVAALVSTSRILSSLVPVDRAAHGAAAAVREFSESLDARRPDTQGFGYYAERAVRLNDGARLDAISALLARHLFHALERRADTAPAQDLGGATFKSSIT